MKVREEWGSGMGILAHVLRVTGLLARVHGPGCPCHFFWCAVLFSASLHAAEDRWSEANRAYETGSFERAKVLYLQMIERGEYSPELFYNLGNAWYKLGDRGRSILNYERALILNPGFVEAKANLSTVRKTLGSSQELHWFSTLRLHADKLAILVAVFFWLALLSLAGRFIGPRRFRRAAMATAIASLALWVGTLGVALFVGAGARDLNRSIVIEPEASLKYGPAVSARSVMALFVGQELSLISQRDDWSFCRLDDGALGWIPTRKIERVVPR
jgi:tetratricopeptide (TPR) repeat protein